MAEMENNQNGNNALCEMLESLGAIDKNYTVQEINEVIAMLNSAKYYARKREEWYKGALEHEGYKGDL